MTARRKFENSFVHPLEEVLGGMNRVRIGGAPLRRSLLRSWAEELRRVATEMEEMAGDEDRRRTERPVQD